MRQELSSRSCLSLIKLPVLLRRVAERSMYIGLNSYAESNKRALFSIEHLPFAQQCIHCPADAKRVTSGVDRQKALSYSLELAMCNLLSKLGPIPMLLREVLQCFVYPLN